MTGINEKNTLRSWLVCFSAALFFFYLVFQLAVFNTIGMGLMHALNINSYTLSQLAAVYLYTCSLFFLPAGILFDHFSTKFLLIAASLLCVIGTIMIAISSTTLMVLIGRILVGISNPFSFLGLMRLVSRWFTQSRAGFVIGMGVTIGMSGGIVAQSPFELLIQTLGSWQHAMLVNAAVGLVITLLLILFVKDSPVLQETIVKNSIQKTSFLDNLKQSCRRKQNWLCGIYTGLIGIPVTVLGALWGNFYLVQAKGYTPVVAGNLTSLIFVGLILGPSVHGWFSDKLSRRKPPIFIGAIGILISSLVILYLNLPTVLLAALFIMLGFFSGAQAITYPLTIESNPLEIESTSLGFISILINVIGASSQMLFGWMINLHWNGDILNGIPQYSSDNFQLALAILPIGFLICLFVSFCLRESFNKRLLS